MLARGARLALLDVSAPGRLARGEVLQFTRYATRLEISDSDGRCLVAERAVLEPQRRALALPGLLDNTPVWGSLYLLDVDLPAEQVCAEIHELQLPLLAASPLPHECGVVVRALGDTPQAVRGALLQVWRMFSPHWRVETAAPAADLQECATLTTGSVSREEESYEHL
jgi:urease accessory protein UreH